MTTEVLASPAPSDSQTITHSNPALVTCGCCKRKIDVESVSVECRTCGEALCKVSNACIGLCACDRTFIGYITQMWFRKSAEILRPFLRANQAHKPRLAA